MFFWNSITIYHIFAFLLIFSGIFLYYILYSDKINIFMYLVWKDNSRLVTDWNLAVIFTKILVFITYLSTFLIFSEIFGIFYGPPLLWRFSMEFIQLILEDLGETWGINIHFLLNFIGLKLVLDKRSSEFVFLALKMDIFFKILVFFIIIFFVSILIDILIFYFKTKK